MFNVGDLVCDKAHTVVGVIKEVKKARATIIVLWNKVPEYMGCKIVVLHMDYIEPLPVNTIVTKHYKSDDDAVLTYKFYDSQSGEIVGEEGAVKAWNLDGTVTLEFEFMDDVSTNDAVNHPSHYTQGNIEVIDYIEDKKLGYHLGNVVKYVSRAGHKNNALEDLKKARWYLDREIKNMEVNCEN